MKLAAFLLSSFTIAIAQARSHPRPHSIARANDHAQIEQGRYLVRIAGCADCHSVNYDQPMAGGYRIDTAFGTFFTPNISPDNDTGIGSWSNVQFLHALRYGVSPKGWYYYPAFPFRSYTKIKKSDVEAMFAYLLSLKPISKTNPPSTLSFPYNQRSFLGLWQNYYLYWPRFTDVGRIHASVGPFKPDENRSESWNRGAYLVEAFAHCAECHTPRDSWLGGPKDSMWMAGAKDVFQGRSVPNITRDVETGLGLWTASDWRRFLTSGRKPTGNFVRFEMADVIRNMSTLTEDDREAMIEYLMSLQPVRNEVPR